MNITQFHAEVLNAPVKNQQWSWGSENDRVPRASGDEPHYAGNDDVVRPCSPR